MLFFDWTRTTIHGAPKSEELTNTPMIVDPMTAPFRSRNWPAFCDEICWICSYFVWNCPLRICWVMNKNVLKSQNIGEGMSNVQDGQNMCWSHRERGAIAILSDERLALFFFRHTYNAGTSLFLLLSLDMYPLLNIFSIDKKLWCKYFGITSCFYHGFTGRRNCGKRSMLDIPNCDVI